MYFYHDGRLSATDAGGQFGLLFYDEKKTTFVVLAVLYILFEPKIVRAEKDFQAFFFYHQFIALFHSCRI